MPCLPLGPAYGGIRKFCFAKIESSWKENRYLYLREVPYILDGVVASAKGIEESQVFKITDIENLIKGR